jgi:hypothetical protein
VVSFTYQGNIISKDGEYSEYVKSWIVKAQGFFLSQLKKYGRTGRLFDRYFLDELSTDCTRLTDRISNSKLCKNVGLSRFLGLWRMTDCQRWSFSAKRKAGHPRMEWKEVVRKDFRRIGSSWEGIKRDALNRLGWRRSEPCCVFASPCFLLQWVVSSSISSTWNDIVINWLNFSFAIEKMRTLEHHLCDNYETPQ